MLLYGTQLVSVLRAAQNNAVGFPAINCTSELTIRGAIEGFAQKNSIAWLEFSTGACEVAGGGNKFAGAQLLSVMANMIAEQYDTPVIVHTDHCEPTEAPNFLDPLAGLHSSRAGAGMAPLFSSHMLDASASEIGENIALSKHYAQLLATNGVLLEVETGVTGGHEEGAASAGSQDHMYTSPAVALMVARELIDWVERSFDLSVLYALNFGNQHGFAGAQVHLRTDVLEECVKTIEAQTGIRSLLVCHGTSGVDFDILTDVVALGAVKFNTDTQTQLSFAQGIGRYNADHHDEIMGGSPVKSIFRPDKSLRPGIDAMAAEVAMRCEKLNCADSVYLM